MDINPGELGSSTEQPKFPRMTVDRETGAIYVYLADDEVAYTTPDVLRGISALDMNLDHDGDGNVIGVEILP